MGLWLCKRRMNPLLMCTQLLSFPLRCVCGNLRKHRGPKVLRSCVPVILGIMTECETSGVDFAVIAGTQSLRSPYKALCRSFGLASTPRCFQSSSSNPENLQCTSPTTTSLKTPISVGGAAELLFFQAISLSCL